MKTIIKTISKNSWLIDLVRRLIENNHKTIKIEIRAYLDTNKKTLDLGCGHGTFCREFKKKQYYGLDIDYKSIQYAKKKYPSYKFKYYSKKIPFKDKTFNNVISLSVLHHIKNKELIYYLREIKRVIKFQGKILVIDLLPIKEQKRYFGKFIFKHDPGREEKEPRKLEKEFKKFFKIKEYKKSFSGVFSIQIWKLEAKK